MMVTFRGDVITEDNDNNNNNNNDGRCGLGVELVSIRDESWV